MWPVNFNETRSYIAFCFFSRKLATLRWMFHSPYLGFGTTSDSKLKSVFSSSYKIYVLAMYVFKNRVLYNKSRSLTKLCQICFPARILHANLIVLWDKYGSILPSTELVFVIECIATFVFPFRHVMTCVVSYFCEKSRP